MSLLKDLFTFSDDNKNNSDVLASVDVNSLPVGSTNICVNGKSCRVTKTANGNVYVTSGY